MIRASVFLLFFCLQSAFASGLQVYPIRLEMAPNDPSAELKIINASKEERRVEVRAVAWSQNAETGVDAYAPTRDILFAPPIFKLAGHTERVIRFRLKRPPEEKQELTYRVYVKELPDESGESRNGVQFNIQFGVPLFVEAVRPQDPKLDITATKVDDTTLRLRMGNVGQTHVKITEVAILTAGIDPEEATAENLLGYNGQPKTGNIYLLSGAANIWEFKVPKGVPENAQVFMQTDYRDGGRGSRFNRQGQYATGVSVAEP